MIPPTYLEEKVKTKKTEEEERNAVATARWIASRRWKYAHGYWTLAHGAVGGVHNRDDGQPIAER